MVDVLTSVSTDYNYVQVSYVYGGANPVSYFRIQRSVAGGAYVTIFESTETADTYLDHEANHGFAHTYRVTGFNVSHAVVTGPTQSIIIPAFSEWVLKDVDTYLDAEAVQLFVDGGRSLNISSKEDLAVFNPIGSKYPIVIRDDKIKSARIPLTLQFLNYTEYEKFDALRHRQKRLKLSGPRQQYNWHVVFTSEFTREVINDVDGYSLVSVEFIEVGNL